MTTPSHAGREDRPPPKSSSLSKVETYHLVLPRDADVESQQLLSGQLLKWIDIAACLSAERHCDMPCVTVSMDGVYFENIPRVGNTVIIWAQVTRAFSTSMEVLVTAACEDRRTRARKSVCKAYLTFMARLKNKTKALLPLILPASEDRSEYLLANERRSNRLKYANALKETTDRGLSHANQVLDREGKPVNAAVTEQLGNLAIDEEDNSGRRGSDVSSEVAVMYSNQTQVSSVELVLPQHCNHHQSVTFGGQIMEWMGMACFIAASRCLAGVPYLLAIDIVRFRQESHVGDRVFVYAQVNRSFGNRVEVGCRVEAQCLGEKSPRHINTSFLVMACHGEGAQEVIVRPDPGSKDDVRRHEEALGRYHLRLERMTYLNSTVSSGTVEAPKWTRGVADHLILSSYERVTKWRFHEDWRCQREPKDGITMFKYEAGDKVCVRFVVELSKPAREVFRKLVDRSGRTKWDLLCKSVRVVERVSELDSIVHYSYVALPGPGQKERDFVLLQSARTPSSEEGAYVICFQSVQHSNAPPQENIERARMISSGYIAEPCSGDSSACKLIYVHQLSRDALAFFAGDLMGISTLLLKLVESLRSYILQ